MYESKPVTRPRSPLKVLWFEFLLNPSLLEDHLSVENPDPSATELIIKFLSNCFNPDQESSNNGGNANQAPNLQQTYVGAVQVEETNGEAAQAAAPKLEKKDKKNQALKLLALKVAAFLKWDLNLFEKKLPLTMQQILITELLKLTGHEIEDDILSTKNKDLNPDSLFARMLYYCWVLRAVIEGSYPVKCQKGLNVQIPGQIDPSVIPAATVETIMRKIQEEAEQATLALEEILEADMKVRMPLLSCFGSVTEEYPIPTHKWEQGFVLKKEDVICQMSYDLGRFYFFQEKYEKASKHFIRASDLYAKLHNPTFCHLNASKLKGFYGACAHLLGYQCADSTTPLKETLQTSVKEGHTQTIDILRSDNIRRELPLALRDAVEINVIQEHSSKTDLQLYVTFLNAMRRTLDGKVVMTDWCSILKTSEEKSSLILCELLKEVIPSCSTKQKIFLKNFVRMVCLVSTPAKVLLKKFEVLSMLLSQIEITELLQNGQQSSKRDTLKLDKNFTDDCTVQVGLLERRLLSTGDAASTKFTVTQLRGKYDFHNLCSINKKWELPRAVAIFLKNVPTHIDQEMIQILLAKSNELRAIKKYGEARQLCQMINSEIRNFSPRLTRYLNWELLRLDLLEILDAPVYICQPPVYRTEIVQRILAFISSFKEREIPPDSGLLELCAAVLLNFREWDKLIEMETKVDPYFEFSRAVASVCSDVFLNKVSRLAPREFWEIILPIFSNPLSNSHKRSNTGVIKDIPRDSSPAIMNKTALQHFVRKIKDTSALGVIISCLAKFYNILKDDSIGEIFFEYQGLWPAVVANCSMFNMSAVGETFQATLHHALSVHPTHSSWLRTKGDVMYVQGHYSAALKFYLSAAMVSTDYFYQMLPKALFDDLMFKHMIHCCTKLQNHTQSAILHQFLEESNYPVAFKALGERVCNDSCDSYYPCIWDVTLLEFLINHHSRRGELECRQLVMQLIGQLELNSNNNEEIQREAANLRKGKFLRAVAKQFL